MMYGSRDTGAAQNSSVARIRPGTAISYYLKSAPSGDVKLTVSDYTGKVVRNIVGTKRRWSKQSSVEPAR